MFQALAMFHACAPVNILNLMTVTYQNCPSTRKRQVTSWTDYVYHLNNSRISCQYVASILSGAVVTTHIAWNALSNQCAHFVFACYCLGCCAVGRQLTIVFDSELVRGTLLDVCVCACPWTRCYMSWHQASSVPAQMICRPIILSTWCQGTCDKCCRKCYRDSTG